MTLNDVEFGAEVRRKYFHFEEGFTFINHGSFGVVPTSIREKRKQLLDVVNDNPDVFYRQAWKPLMSTAIQAAAEFLGADPNNVVLVQNATTGGHIHQFEIGFPIKNEEEIVRNMASALDEHPNVRMAVLDHITSPSALLLPIKKMIEECRKRRVLVLIDGAHAPGQAEINLEELCPDFYTGNFHKWVYTPRGSAILWVHKDHQGWCTPLVTSHMYNKGFQLEYGQQGTRDDTPYFLIPDAIQFYKDMGGMDKIVKYTKKLLDDACRMMAERLQTELPQIPQSMEAAGMRLVLLPDFDKFERYTKTWEGSENLYNDIMNIHKINCAVYPIQGELFLRLSANIYNEMDDYVKLADLLVQLLKKV
uniref:Aminotransferase class V domain-containing protein n=1 Tax=Magallana gigas TaxID=29159 RepID=A0A8W8N1D3_MAGGI